MKRWIVALSVLVAALVSVTVAGATTVSSIETRSARAGFPVVGENLGFSAGGTLIVKAAGEAYDVAPGAYAFAGFGFCLEWDGDGNCISHFGYSCYPDADNLGDNRLPNADALAIDFSLDSARLEWTFACNDPGQSTLAVDVTWTGEGSYHTFSANYIDDDSRVISQETLRNGPITAEGTFRLNGTEYEFGSTTQFTIDLTRYRATSVPLDQP